MRAGLDQAEDGLKPECSNCPVLSNALIRNLSREQASRFTCVFRPTHYRRSQVLFFEGGTAEHLFALRAGLVKMVKPLQNGKERIVRVLLPGEIFGLEALSEATYPLTGVVLQDSDICAVSRQEFLAFLRANSDIALELIRVLVGEMALIRGQITSLSFKDARMRLATFLLSLLPPDGALSTGACSLTLPLSTQEIGEVLELSSETVSRAWGRLRREGLVEKRGRHVVIQDLNALERATQG
jgi:CRP-like cAMP-binding protein